MIMSMINIENLYRDIEKVLNENYLCMFIRDNFDKTLRSQDIDIKNKSIKLYVETMIKLYFLSPTKKNSMFYMFGCSFYRQSNINFLDSYQPIKTDCEIQIKKGILEIIIGSNCVLLLMFVNDLIIY